MAWDIREIKFLSTILKELHGYFKSCTEIHERKKWFKDEDHNWNVRRAEQLGKLKPGNVNSKKPSRTSQMKPSGLLLLVND